MKKINFQDLPNTETPINSTNLNKIQDNIENVFNGNEAMGSIVVENITSKNLFNFNNLRMDYANVDYINRTITFNSFNNATTNKLKDICPDLVAGEMYTFSFETTSSVKYIYLNGSQSTWWTGNARTITQAELDDYILFYGGSDIDQTMSKIQIEKGSVVSDYVPHKDLSGGEAYSTEEIVVGTWVNGKPLYRKVVGFTTSSGLTSFSSGISNIQAMVDLRGGSGGKPINYYLKVDGAEYFISTQLDEGSGIITHVCSPEYANKPGYIIIDYTKTTD